MEQLVSLVTLYGIALVFDHLDYIHVVKQLATLVLNAIS